MPQPSRHGQMTASQILGYAVNLKPLLEPIKNDRPEISAFYTGYLEIIERLQALEASTETA